jgi:hypothetical protein
VTDERLVQWPTSVDLEEVDFDRMSAIVGWSEVASYCCWTGDKDATVDLEGGDEHRRPAPKMTAAVPV